MILIELEKKEFEKIEPLSNGSEHMEFTIESMLHKSPARVWVDSKSNPQTAFVWDKSWIFYFLGNPDNKLFNKSIINVIENEIKNKIYNQAKIEYHPKEWNDKILDLFKDNFPTIKNRKFLKIDKIKVPDWKNENIKQITKEILESKVKNIESIHDELNQMWNNFEDFLNEGFGFCTILKENGEDSIQGWCTGEYFSKEKCGIGIETFSPNRNKGYATLMSAALVDYAQKIGITVYWEAETKNLPSIRVAEKVGFELIQEYQVFIVGLNNVEAHKGSYYYEIKEFEKAAEAFKSAAENNEQRRANNHYNSACCYNLVGEKKFAIDQLKKSIKSMKEILPNFINHIKQEKDFFSLHEEEEWTELLMDLE